MRPKHYQISNDFKGKNFDVIDICKAYDLNFNCGNVLKYVCRAGKKDDHKQDLKKALEYLVREIEYLEQNKQK